MQVQWGRMSNRLENQKTLNKELIMEMTQQRYSDRFSKLMNYEILGALICFSAALGIIIYFAKLDTWHLQLAGVFTIAYLTVLPALVLGAIQKIRRLNIARKSYKETLISFSKAKQQLLLVQRSGIILNFLFLLVCLPVAGKILSNKDILLFSNEWLWFVPVMGLFLFFFSRWGYSCYKSVTASAERIIKEIDEI